MTRRIRRGRVRLTEWRELTVPEDTDLDLMAGEFVLGALAGDERARFVARMAADPAAAARVAAWERRLSAMEAQLEDVPPSAGMFAAIMRRIEAEQGRECRTVAAAAGEWRNVAPGIALKRLHRDPEDGRESVLLRLAPGAVIAAHDHRQDEECLVLEGAIMIGSLRLAAGDFHVAFRASPHDTIVSPGGALLYIRGAIPA